MTPGNSILVGDIGGTHARFAILEHDALATQLHDWSDLPGDCGSFTQAVQHYLAGIEGQQVPDIIALAVAGPVAGGKVRLTNRDWQISESELRSLGFRAAYLVNDFAALAWAADGLGSADLRCIGPDVAGAP